MSGIRVLIADGQPLFAEALGAALARTGEFQVAGSYPQSGVDTLRAVEEHDPEVALVDLCLHGSRPPAVTSAIRARSPDTQVLNISALYSLHDVREALQAGAVGFLPKTTRLATVEEALRRAHAGDNPVFREDLERHLGRIETFTRQVSSTAQQLEDLSPREMEVLRLLAAGLDVAQIAARLDLKRNTIRAYVRGVLSKTETHSQLEAIALAREAGLVP